MEKELAELYPEPDRVNDTRFADKLVKVYHRDDEYLKEERAEGREEGRIEEREHLVENLLRETDLPVEKIASVANVTVDFVNGVKYASKAS